MPSALRQSVLIPIFKGKGDIQESKHDRAIKLLSHTLKIWERDVDRRIRQCTNIDESQFGFMPGRSSTDAIFIMKQTKNMSRGLPTCSMLIRKSIYAFMISTKRSCNTILQNIVGSDHIYTSPLLQHWRRMLYVHAY